MSRLPQFQQLTVERVAVDFSFIPFVIGAIVLVAGSTLHTEVASVFIFNVIQDGEPAQAAAVAIVLLGAGFVLLLAVGALRFYATRHERA